MDANFERMLAQAVRSNHAGVSPQEPTVPDKCVIFSGPILSQTSLPQWRSYTHLIPRSAQGLLQPT